MNSQPQKMISIDLLNKTANYIASSVGHSYIETDALIKELSSLPDVPEVKEEKKDK